MGLTGTRLFKANMHSWLIKGNTITDKVNVNNSFCGQSELVITRGFG